MALVDLDEPNITVHRLIQDAYIHYLLETGGQRLEAAFASAIHLLYQRFPRQINGRPMHGDWQKCRELIEHARWLAERFSEVRAMRKGFPIPKGLAELLKHCAWSVMFYVRFEVLCRTMLTLSGFKVPFRDGGPSHCSAFAGDRAKCLH